MLSTIFWVIFLLTTVFILYKSFQRVGEANVRLVERLGKYNRTLKPGINFIIPFIESIKISDITTYDKDPSSPDASRSEMRYISSFKGDLPTLEIIMDPPQIDAISLDNANVYPDALLYFRIVDPIKATYEIENLGMAIYKLLETTLRQEIGVLESDEIIKGRELIGNKIKTALEEASTAWGTVITRVELEEIRFGEEVEKALSDQRAAELEGRAKVAKSERDREATIITAEADKRRIVLAAEAQFEKEKLEAEADFLKASRELEGQAQGTEALTQALERNPDSIVALEALKAQMNVAEAIGRSSNTLIIPEETAGLVGAIKSIEKILAFNAKREESK